MRISSRLTPRGPGGGEPICVRSGISGPLRTNTPYHRTCAFWWDKARRSIADSLEKERLNYAAVTASRVGFEICVRGRADAFRKNAERCKPLAGVTAVVRPRAEMAPRRRIASLLRKINVLRVPSAAGRSIIGSLRDHMAEPSKETVIIVHGTWATPDPLKRRWYEPDDGRPGGEPFPAKLDAALRERGSPARCWAHCSQGNRIFQWWPGENSWMARTRAASALAGYVTKLRNEGWLCHFVAHSHGGNVLLEALPLIRVSPNSSEGLQGKLVILGTPFMDTTSAVTERIEWRRKKSNCNPADTRCFRLFCISVLLSWVG